MIFQLEVKSDIKSANNYDSALYENHIFVKKNDAFTSINELDGGESWDQTSIENNLNNLILSF